MQIKVLTLHILESSISLHQAVLSFVSDIDIPIFPFGFLGDSSSHGALLWRPQRRVRVAGDTRRRGHSLQTVFSLRLPWTRFRLAHEVQYIPPTMPWGRDGALPAAWMVIHSDTWWGLHVCAFSSLQCLVFFCGVLHQSGVEPCSCL